MQPDELKQILEAVMSLPCMAWCEEQMAKSSAEAQKMEYDEDHKEEGMEQSGEVPVEGDEVPEEEGKEKFDEEHKEEDKEEEVGEPKLRAQYDQAKRRYAKLEAENKALAERVKVIETKERIATRNSDLLQLEAEGYAFDLPNELDYVKDMDVVRYSKHLHTIRNNYKQKPIGFSVKSVVPQETNNNLSQEEILRKAEQRVAERWGKK